MQFLIVKLSSLGDILAAYKFPFWIKSLYPQASVDWVIDSRFASFFLDHPLIDQVIPFDTRRLKKGKIPFRQIQEFRKKRYDLVIDLQGNCKSGLFTLLAKASRKAGYDYHSLAEWPNLLATRERIRIDTSQALFKQYEDFFNQLFKCVLNSNEGFFRSQPVRLKKELHFMVCPGSNWINKTLSEEDLILFLDQISEKFDPRFVFTYGNEKEEELINRLKARFTKSEAYGRLSLSFWSSLIDQVDLVISVDSASLQLAGLSKTPIFALFGPSSSKVYLPREKDALAYQGSCPYKIQFEKRCPHLRSCSSGDCLRKVDVEKLFDTFQTFFSNFSKSM